MFSDLVRAPPPPHPRTLRGNVSQRRSRGSEERERERMRDGATVAECRRTTHGARRAGGRWRGGAGGGGREGDGRTERASERGDPRALRYSAQSSSVRQPVIFRTYDRQLARTLRDVAPAERSFGSFRTASAPRLAAWSFRRREKKKKKKQHSRRADSAETSAASRAAPRRSGPVRHAFSRDTRVDSVGACARR